VAVIDSAHRAPMGRGSIALLLAALVCSLGAARPVHADSVVVSTDVAYRTVDGLTLRLDICRPRRDGSYPVVLLLHGGGWAAGDKAEWQSDCKALASEDGLVAVAPNYRLAPPGAPGSHANAPVDDLAAAVAWLQAHAAAYELNPQRIGCLGESAGGHLCMMLGVRSQVRSVASWSGTSYFPSQVGLLNNDGQDVGAVYIGCPLTNCPAAWQAASPRPAVSARTAPTYLANSDAEVIPLEQVTGMADALAGAGIPHQLRVLSGTRHARQYEADVWPETVTWLKGHL
jgi:acetyl esterase